MVSVKCKRLIDLLFFTAEYRNCLGTSDNLIIMKNTIIKDLLQS